MEPRWWWYPDCLFIFTTSYLYKQKCHITRLYHSISIPHPDLVQSSSSSSSSSLPIHLHSLYFLKVMQPYDVLQSHHMSCTLSLRTCWSNEIGWAHYNYITLHSQTLQTPTWCVLPFSETSQLRKVHVASTKWPSIPLLVDYVHVDGI